MIWSIVALVAYALLVGVIIRVVVEITRSFARTWRPVGATAVGLEIVYTVTDPPVRLLRRVIPPLRIGQVSLDLSVLILLILLSIVRAIALNFV
ncbi:YggT family protein [Jatrophihabitans sp. YIM 134969]